MKGKETYELYSNDAKAWITVILVVLALFDLPIALGTRSGVSWAIELSLAALITLALTYVHRLELDGDAETFRYLRGLWRFARVASGPSSELGQIDVGTQVVSGKYSSWQIYFVTVGLPHGVTGRRQLCSSTDYQEAARFAARLQDLAGLHVEETASLQALRSQFATSPYDDQPELPEPTKHRFPNVSKNWRFSRRPKETRPMNPPPRRPEPPSQEE